MSNSAKFTIKDLQKQFPNDDVCLEKLFDLRYGQMLGCPKCAVSTPKYYRVKNRKCFQCNDCLNQIYPMAGTIFEGSTTALTLWFHTIFLFASSKNGVSAKEIQRQIGVTYKCAWRMGHCIRTLMDEGDIMLEGIVEMDESLFGGKGKGKRGWGAENKTCMFGVIEKGGKIKVQTVAGRTKEVILPLIVSTVMVGTMIHTDEYKLYNVLGEMGYGHESVIHSRFQWRTGDCHTNSIEGFWGNLKRSLKGTHTFVSPKHLQKYLNEFNFRHNNRKGTVMFEEMIKRL